MGKKDIEGRLAALERQIAEIRVRAVEAGEYRLVDKAGRLRAVMEMTRAGPRLVMMHEDGKVALEATVAKDGPSLCLADGQGQTRVFVGATRDEARIGLADGKGAPRAYLGVNRRGKATLTIYDGKQQRLWQAPG